MRNTHSPLPILLFVAGCWALSTAHADEAERPIRELHVPVEALDVLLASQPERVLLSRDEYDALVALAERQPTTDKPQDVIVTSAEYSATVLQRHAEVTAVLTVDVLSAGLHGVPLGLPSAGLRAASLDGAPAAMGQDGNGMLRLFVEGVGRHELRLDLAAPVEASAASQTLHLGGPRAATTRLELRVPGNVDVKGGAEVVSRTFDEESQRTTFKLLFVPGPMAIDMTLNNRMVQTQRVVVAQSVQVVEVARPYEQLHASFAMQILHRPTDRLRFELPAGFELSSVASPILSSWSIDDSGRVLDVRLREDAIGMVPVALSAIRTPPLRDDWTLPRIVPIDAATQTAVVGILLEDRLDLVRLDSRGLISLDNSSLTRALPPSVFQADPGAPRVRPIAAYYDPAGRGTTVSAEFALPVPKLHATGSMLLALGDRELTLQAGFELRPTAEDLLAVEFMLPVAWHIHQITKADGTVLEHEVVDRGDETASARRVRVTFSPGNAIAAGTVGSLYVYAAQTPPGWLSEWDTFDVSFPRIGVRGAAECTGVIAVQTGPDMDIFPDTLGHVTPMDPAQRQRFGLDAVSARQGALAYRFDRSDYRASFVLRRIAPRLTARSYSFFEIEPDVLRTHYQIDYDVQRARTRELAFSLPAETPTTITIRGLDGINVEETRYVDTGDVRRWRATLSQRRSGRVRIAVEFEQRLGDADTFDVLVPLVSADGVLYQSGAIAIEGSPELDIRIDDHPRPIDVGELAPSVHQPAGRVGGGLSVFGFVGEPPEVLVHVSRRPSFGLPPSIIQRAELTSALAGDGTSYTAARLLVRAKTAFVDIEFPAGSTLWSIELDGRPAKPQRAAGRVRVSLQSKRADSMRDLRVVYESPASAFSTWDEVALPALVLRLPGSSESPGAKLPIADVEWRVHIPSGFSAVAQSGTVTSDSLDPPESAAWKVALAFYRFGGGVDFLWGGCLPSLARARQISKGSMRRMSSYTEDYYYEPESPVSEAATQPTTGERGRRMEFPKIDLPSVVRKADPGAPSDELSTGYSSGGYGGKQWFLTGVRSLKIALGNTDQAIVFRSLGENPELRLTLVDRRRTRLLAIGLAMLVGAIGVALTRQRPGRKAAYVVAVVLLATIAPLIVGQPELIHIANPMFYTGCLLIPYYIVAALALWGLGWLRKLVFPGPATSTTAAMLLLVAGMATARGDDDKFVVQVVEPAPPVTIPADAIVVPYDPNKPGTDARTGEVLVPYRRYLELWQRAYPDAQPAAPPTRYTVSAANYAMNLGETAEMRITGTLIIDVFTNEPVSVPLSPCDAVIVSAELDGQPARLSVEVSNPVHAQQIQQSGQVASPMVNLHIHGRGRHRLSLVAEVRRARQGGWRMISTRLPSAPATQLAVTVPEARTETRIEAAGYRIARETAEAGETIVACLPASGVIDCRWRPRAHATVVDPTLTVESNALFEVREDGLRAIWQLVLDTGRTERDGVTLHIPADYWVHAVRGPNIRGFRAEPTDESASTRSIEVRFLKPASGTHSIGMVLYQGQAAGPFEPARFDAPLVRVEGAVLHKGTITVLRSPVVQLRAQATVGIRRIDLPDNLNALESLAASAAAAPLGTTPFQAYRFGSMPFKLRLECAAVPDRPNVDVQTILRIAESDRTIESRFRVQPNEVPVYDLVIALPAGFELDRLVAPEPFEHTIVRDGDKPTLAIHLGAGQAEPFDVILAGDLAAASGGASIPLPTIWVRNAERQAGQIAIQVDPAFDARLVDLDACEEQPVQRLHAWLEAVQHSLTRLAVRYRDAHYAGTVRLDARVPRVRCTTISNVRFTDTAIEETILLDFEIRRAGIDTIEFVLPRALEDAVMTVPLLREKSVEAVHDAADAPVRVRMILQKEVMGHVRVLIEDSRLFTSNVHQAPIPRVETGETIRRSITLENAGRDELTVVEARDVERLTHRAQAWRALSRVLGASLTEAYLVSGNDPALALQTKPRATVVTAGARIGLAETTLVVDAHGAFRGTQRFRIDNTTEQHLEVVLPAGSSLWAAIVAEQPVKPASAPDGLKPRHVRIPLIKTAAGDVDFEVRLYYAGTMRLSSLFGACDFPFVEAVNIPVELSQVRLHLPESFEWFDFGGTMRQVESESALAAGFVRYHTRQAERLVQTIEAGDAFARARALVNVDELRGEMGQFQTQAADIVVDADLRRELEQNEQVLQRADEQAHLMWQAEREIDPVSLNSAQLNVFFEAQSAFGARDAVKDLPDNWARVMKEPTSGRLPARDIRIFVSGDRDGDGLIDAAEATDVGDTLGEAGGRIVRMKGDGDKLGEAVSPKEDAKVGWGVVKRQAGVPESKLKREEASELYQQQLVQRRDRRQRVDLRDRDGDKESAPSVGSDVPTTGAYDVWNENEVALPSESEGLSSLSVEIPTRGRTFYFTTPRGDVEVQARAIDRRTLDVLRNGGIALIGVSIGWLVFVLVRRISDVRFGATLMMAVGLVLIVLGVLPVVGVVLAVAGLVQRSRASTPQRA